MSSISSTNEQSSLLASARAEWLQRAQSKAQATGGKVAPTPSNSELISEDAELAREIAAAESATDSATQAAVSAASSSVNIVA